jgi:NADH-quinone oxidoreductase subunit F
MTNPNPTPSSFTTYLHQVAPRGRTMLIPALLAAQEAFGCVPRDVAAQIGEALKVPLAEVTGVIEFYSMLYTHPTGETLVRVCTSPTCSAGGAKRLFQAALETFGLESDGSTEDGKHYLEEVACLGLCDLAPAALVGEQAVGHATPAKLMNPNGQFRTQVFAQEAVITRRFGVIDPTSLQDYLDHDGYQGLRNALDIESDYICDFMSSSGLLGRGGAAFVTRTKWQSGVHCKAIRMRKPLLVILEAGAVAPPARACP